MNIKIVNDVLIDFTLNQVTKKNELIKLEPRVSDVLRFLIENHNQLVSRDEIIDSVWKDQSVGYNSLNRNIGEIRKVLDNKDQQPSCIKTIPKKGYIFIADVFDGQNKTYEKKSGLSSEQPTNPSDHTHQESPTKIDGQLSPPLTPTAVKKPPKIHDELTNTQIIPPSKSLLYRCFKLFKRKNSITLLLMVIIGITTVYFYITFNKQHANNVRKTQLSLLVHFEQPTLSESEFAKDLSHNLLEKLITISSIQVHSITSLDPPSSSLHPLSQSIDNSLPFSNYLLKVHVRQQLDQKLKVTFYLVDTENNVYLWSKNEIVDIHHSRNNEEKIWNTVQSLSQSMNWQFKANHNAQNTITPKHLSANQRLVLAPKAKGRAFCLDGLDDFEEFNLPGIDVTTHDFSIGAWVKTTSLETIIIVDKRFEHRKGNVQGYNFHLYQGLMATQLADGKGDWLCSPIPSEASCTNYLSDQFIADGQWHFVLFTVDRDNTQGMIFYVDGVEKQRFDPTNRSGSLSNNQPLRIGSRSSSQSALFPGSIGEVSLHNYSLSPFEVKQLYNKGVSRQCELPL